MAGSGRISIKIQVEGLGGQGYKAWRAPTYILETTVRIYESTDGVISFNLATKDALNFVS